MVGQGIFLPSHSPPAKNRSRDFLLVIFFPSSKQVSKETKSTFKTSKNIFETLFSTSFQCRQSRFQGLIPFSRELKVVLTSLSWAPMRTLSARENRKKGIPWGLVSLEDTGKKDYPPKLPSWGLGRSSPQTRKDSHCGEWRGGQVQGQSLGLPGRGQLPRDLLKDNVPSELTPPLPPRLAKTATIKN